MDFGLGNTAAVYQHVLKSPVWCQNLLSKHLNMEPYVDTNVDVIKHSYILSVIRCASKGWDDDLASGIAIAETLSPQLGIGRFLNHDEAFASFRGMLMYLFSTQALMNNLLAKVTTNANETKPAAIKRILNLPNVPLQAADITAFKAYTEQQIKAIWVLMVPMFTDIYDSVPASLIGTVHFALIKQGTATAQALRKYLADMVACLGHEVEIDIGLSKVIYMHVLSHLKPNEIKATVEHWLTITPAHMIRMRIFLLQAANRNLTCFNTIGKAILKFADFPWAVVSAAIGGNDELSAWYKAFQEVKGDPYYGYLSDLKSAKSTNFKNLGAVCAHLLTVLAGDATIAKAKSIKPYDKVSNQAAVVNIVDAYVAAYAVAVRAPVGAHADFGTELTAKVSDAATAWPAYTGFN